MVQVQPREHVLLAVGCADCTHPTRQHELDHARSGTDDTSALKYLDPDLWMIYLCKMICSRCEKMTGLRRRLRGVRLREAHPGLLRGYVVDVSEQQRGERCTTAPGAAYSASHLGHVTPSPRFLV